MSRSNRKESLPNPTEHYLQWNGDEGYLFEYDSVQKERVPIDLPCKLAVLDVVSCIAGFSDEWKAKIWSNEVKQLDSEKLFVYAGQVKQMDGYYAEMRDSVKAIGGKFASSVYAAWIREGEEPALVNIKLYGAALSSWIDFQKGQNDYKGQGKVKVTKTGVLIIGPSDMKKKGKTEYFQPIFGTFDISDDEDAIAVEMDEKVLQPYLESKSQIPTRGDEQQKEEEAQKVGKANVYDPDAEGIDEVDEPEMASDDYDQLPF